MTILSRIIIIILVLALCIIGGYAAAQVPCEIKRCKVYAAALKPKPHYIDSVSVSSDSVGFAIDKMLNVKGSDFVTVKCGL